MSEKWEWVTLDKLGKLSSGKSLSQKSGYAFSLFFNGDIPLIDGASVSQSRLHIDKCNRFFNLRGLKQNKLFPENTVCFVRCGNTGDCSILKRKSCLTETIHTLSTLEGISDPKFIKYCFDFPKIKKRIRSISKLSMAHSILSFQKLFLVNFPKPPFKIQQKIGEILSRYDLILDNHERQIELLKNLKVSLFKEWFIKLRFPDYESHSIRGGYLKAGRESK